MSFIEYLRKNSSGEGGKEPLSDKIFLRSIAISFFAILICIVMLSASTFAWFNATVESKEETITASVYKLTVSTDPDLTPAVQDDNKIYTLAAGTEYTVTILAVADETTTGKTGYVKLVVDGNTYISQQIDRGEQLEFKLTFDSETTVEIIECWGTSSTPSAERDVNSGDSFVNMQKKTVNP